MLFLLCFCHFDSVLHSGPFSQTSFVFQKTQGFKTTWKWLNNDFHFWWTVALNVTKRHKRFTQRSFPGDVCWSVCWIPHPSSRILLWAFPLTGWNERFLYASGRVVNFKTQSFSACRSTQSTSWRRTHAVIKWNLKWYPMSWRPEVKTNSNSSAACKDRVRVKEIESL